MQSCLIYEITNMCIKQNDYYIKSFVKHFKRRGKVKTTKHTDFEKYLNQNITHQLTTQIFFEVINGTNYKCNKLIFLQQTENNENDT